MTTPGFFERKGDVATLKSRLRDAVTKKDSKLCHSVIKKTIQLMTLGIDVSSICPEIIMASATTDIVQKKLVYTYLCSCAESNSETALLAINTLVKDARDDDNAMIRGLALRSMLNMRILDLVQYARLPLLSALQDKSSYVRRNALLAAVKLFRLDVDMFLEMDLMDIIRNSVYENDGQVSYTALVALDEISLSEGGVNVDKELMSYLISRLHGYNEFAQSVILEILTRYKPQDEDEVLHYMNVLDDRLKHSNKGVVMATVKLLLLLTANMDWIKNDLYERIRSPMLLMLFSATADIAYPILCHISVLISLQPRLFHKDYKHFFIRNNEPTYVRQKKLDILTCITTEGNLKAIVDEITEYVHDSDISISCRAIQSIGNIGLEYSFAKDVCVNRLIEVLSLEVDHITSKCVQTLQHLFMKYPTLASRILPELHSCWEQVQHHDRGKSALIWIYGEYGENIPAAPYHLEELIKYISEEQSVMVKLNLLTAMMKLFFKRPPECQIALGKLFKYTLDDEVNMDVRDRALFYYRLVSLDIEQAKTIVQCKGITLCSSYPSVVEKQILSCDDFRVTEFNTLSVVYDAPSNTFITSKIQEKLFLSLPDGTAKSPMSRMRVEEVVAVGNLLDVHEDLSVLLVKDFVMEQNSFQTGWKNMQYILKREEQLTVLPEHKEILTVMEREDIGMMACNRAEDKVWKFFFYSKIKHSGAVVLVELIIDCEESRMSVVVKTHNRDELQRFTDFYMNLFLGKWVGHKLS